MMKVTRSQVAEVINMDMVALHAHTDIEPERLTVKDIGKLARGAWGEVALLMTGAKLYRYRDGSGSPAYAIMGYRSDGADVSALLALLPTN